MKLLTGKIKNNCSENWKGLEGIKLVVCKFKETDKELNVISPIKLDEMEKFYKFSWEEGLKDDISDDYDYYIWYMLDEYCELICSIGIDDLEELKDLTIEEDKEYGENLEKFKKLHKYYEIERQINDNNEAEEKANKEFSKEEKTKIITRTKTGNEEVDAVIYKGFGVHEILGVLKDTYKTITVLDGEFKGMSISNVPVSKYREIIDKIKESIGDRFIEKSDSIKLKEIIEQFR
ncbi:hypothetical protein OSC52_15330 [Clostridium pasteurianum]|uniref:hypothetical protein n=1 Tax=Clostridium pasteurianum TaxID=1501 RepID=UPI002260A27A|nr:hypothetical protein [Clostridium pasteurianum]UZW13208.1 hypothetical protein OSC52_15330 [Clostridium pasteurianum]